MGHRIDFIKSGLLKGYKFDGCTNAPDFQFEKCCNRHDYDYQNMSMSRKEADSRLRKCMQSKGAIFLPWFYWAAVRIFGGSHFTRKQDESRKQFENDLVGIDDRNGA